MTVVQFPTGGSRGPLADPPASGREPYGLAVEAHAARQTAKLWRTEEALEDALSDVRRLGLQVDLLRAAHRRRRRATVATFAAAFAVGAAAAWTAGHIIAPLVDQLTR